MKKVFTMLLCFLLAFSACSVASAEEAVLDEKSVGAQSALLLDAFSTFKPVEMVGTWYATVTDLDHNGRLELLTAAIDNAGVCRELRWWEMGQDGKSNGDVVDDIPEGVTDPGVFSGKAEAWFDEQADTWYYLFTNELTLSPQDTYAFRCAISLKDGIFTYRYLPTLHTQTIGGRTESSLLDASGAELSVNTAGVQGEYALSGEKQQNPVEFAWIAVPELNAASCDLCYRIFTGEKNLDEMKQPSSPEGSASQNHVPATTMPIYTPAPTFTPAPSISNDATHDPIYDDLFASQKNIAASSAPSAPAETTDPTLTHDPLYAPVAPYFPPDPTPTPRIELFITRSPTDENRKVGSTASFVANANIRDSLRWVFVAPDGGEMSWQEFAAIFPGSQISGVSEGVLSVSNVSEEMNGWGAYCIFYYGDQQASSGIGYIWVS